MTPSGQSAVGSRQKAVKRMAKGKWQKANGKWSSGPFLKFAVCHLPFETLFSC
jgi:hypothetical protein